MAWGKTMKYRHPESQAHNAGHLPLWARGMVRSYLSHLSKIMQPSMRGSSRYALSRKFWVNFLKVLFHYSVRTAGRRQLTSVLFTKKLHLLTERRGLTCQQLLPPSKSLYKVFSPSKYDSFEFSVISSWRKTNSHLRRFAGTTLCAQWRIKAFLHSRQDKIFRPSASFFSYTPPVLLN